MHHFPWPERASDFSLKKRKVIGRALCSCAIVSKAFGLAMQLSMCSGWVPGWVSQRLSQLWKGLLINISAQVERKIMSTVNNLFVVLTQADQCPKFP